MSCNNIKRIKCDDMERIEFDVNKYWPPKSDFPKSAFMLEVSNHIYSFFKIYNEEIKHTDNSVNIIHPNKALKTITTLTLLAKSQMNSFKKAVCQLFIFRKCASSLACNICYICVFFMLFISYFIHSFIFA